jgi:non-ribosomal peptide synthetase component E (peptide arylation enzyme)
MPCITGIDLSMINIEPMFLYLSNYRFLDLRILQTIGTSILNHHGKELLNYQYRSLEKVPSAHLWKMLSVGKSSDYFQFLSVIHFRQDKLTYRQLKDQVAQVAGLLARLGVVKGDRVLIYMPMVPEAVVAMLATVRLGAIHSVVFGGFAAKELATRIRHAEPKVNFHP